MSDDKFSLDDILAEVDRKREHSGSAGRSREVSVTEIIDTDDINAILRTGKQKKSKEETAPEMSSDAQTGLAAKQLTEAEENTRRAADIASAADRKRKAEEQKAAAKKLREEKEAEKRSAELKKSRAAKQRTEEEENSRRAADIAAAADKQEKRRRAAKEKAADSQEALSESSEAVQPEEEVSETELHGITGELSTTADASRLFGEPEEDAKPAPEFSPDPDDDAIVFHTKSDLVTTDTMEIRKQQRIEDINRALLSVDQNAETTDELLDSLNPMDSRAKAAEELKSASEDEKDMTDTIAVAGNDLKNLANGTEEKVKEYAPPASRKKSKSGKRVEDILFTPRTGAQKPLSPSKAEDGSEALVKSLSKKLEESRESGEGADRTVVIDDLSEVGKAPSEPLNLDGSKLIDTSVLADEDEKIEAVRRADELAQKKKSRLASFMLEDIADEVASAGDEDTQDEDDEEYEEEEIDLDDENVIAERLNRESRGLLSRLVILGLLFIAALFIAVTNEFNINLGAITDLVSKRSHPDYFLYANLIIGILSFSACSSVIQNGFSRLLRLRPDGDTLCAFSHITAIAALIPYLSLPEYVQRGRSHVYLIVSLAALCFNTISKLCILKSAQRNFKFISGDGAKYFVQHINDGSADKLAGSTVDGIPEVASMRKTEMLCDFIISTYCEDASDRVSRIFVPVTLAAAIGSGVIAYFMGESSYVWNNISWASTVASAIFAIGAGFIGSLIVTLPLLSASKKMPAQNSAILGYNAIEEFSETNAALVEAKSLFPANSVKINNIWDYNKHRSSNSPKIAIDEAIIYAASLSVTADSVLSDAFFNMLNYKHQLLKQVTDCVYESNLGIMGTIERRRVLLGNREHMKSHQIIVPELSKEKAANKNDDEVIYLAVNGEVCMLFFVELSANQQVKAAVNKLDRQGISLIIKTVDGMITPAVIADLFEIEASHCRIIPFEYHDTFKELTKYVSKGSAALSCDGTFTAFAGALSAAKNLRSKINAGCILSVGCCALGIILAVIFMLFTNYNMFSSFAVLLYNLACLAVTLGIQAFGRI